MDKERILRKKSLDRRSSLPPPPELLNASTSSTIITLVTTTTTSTTTTTNSGDTIKNRIPNELKYLMGYKEREKKFINLLKENCSETQMDEKHENINTKILCCEKEDKCDISTKNYETECENYVRPLLNRTGPSIVATLATQDAIDQLDKLHGLLYQLLSLQEQNYKMRRNVRDLETIYGLKKLQKEMSTNDETNASDQYKDDDVDLEFLEFTQNEKLLETILATGRSASNKRNNSKRQRSKSVFNEELQFFNDKGNELKHYPLCRQTAVTDIKAKVSKWTKVKAAFKWERANVSPLNESKSTDSGIGLAPVNNEIAKYLRVPSVPCAGSSGDSIFSSSSGHMLSGSASSASSIDDIYNITEVNNRTNRYSVKSESQSQSDDFGRSRSLDGEVVLVPTLEKAKNKTPWRKVKDIIQTHRGSFKVKKRTRSLKSAGSGGLSRDISPCDSIDALSNSEMFENFETHPITKSSSVKTPSLKLTKPGIETGSCPSSPISGPSILSNEEHEENFRKRNAKHLRRNKLISDIEILPENYALDLKTKLPPSPLTIRQDSSDAEILDPSISPLASRGSKWSKVKKAFLAGSSSGPNSPIHHTEFFGDSEDLSSGDFSEPSSPHKLEKSAYQNNEIKKRFFELQRKLNQEFEIKQMSFERIRAASTTNVPFKEESLTNRLKVTKPVLEDNLSPDFKKKLHEWRIKKQQSLSSIKEYQPAYSTNCQRNSNTDTKKIDWQLWKTGQFKLEGQGLSQLPDEKDLSEDFQKKLDEWKRMKANNSRASSTHDFSYKTKLSLQKSDPQYTKKSEMEKEWHKIEREQQRRLREKVKIEEREKAEKLSKLKRAVTADPPNKEVVVQTSEGLLKFEGISRKFTRKLYEWEKSRGIGPESSTFALLHPGYRPIDVGNVQRESKNRETNTCLIRSMSADSLSQNQSIASISHQPSSLSLNDADDLKDNNSTNDRRVSSNPELDISNNEVQSDEPEAVIVEVEDDIEETAAPLITTSPSISHQMPVYKYEKSCNQICSAPKTLLRRQKSLENKESLQILRDTTIFLEKCESDYLDINGLNSHLELILDVLPYLPKNIKKNFPSSFELIMDVIDEMKDMFISLEKTNNERKDDKLARLYKKMYILRNLINNLCSDCEMFNEMQINPACEQIDKIPIISITQNVASTSSTTTTNKDNLNNDIDNKAYVTITPTLVRNKVIVSQVQILNDSRIDENDLIIKHNNERVIVRQSSKESIKSERIIDKTYGSIDKNLDGTSRTQLNELDIKKITKTINNGTKRKTKTRRLGSRQNSKTESDSDDDAQHIILDAPRKCKRKTSRAKKIYDSEKIELESQQQLQQPLQQQPQQQQCEDIVYVLKIKPNQKTELNLEETQDIQSSILISPQETCVELLDGSLENISSSTNNIFVKTKRKIFSPVDLGQSVIAKDLESSSASDKNDNEKIETNKINMVNLDDENKIIRNLPPLPQSPITQRRIEEQKVMSSSKELSPSIRLMIAKYNQRLSADKTNISPLSSGSCSPIAWRSPVLERRVRAQTEKYQEKVVQLTKSTSVESIRKINKIEKSNSCSENFNKNNIKPLKGVLKSLSAGRLETDWKTKTIPVTGNISNQQIDKKLSFTENDLKNENNCESDNNCSNEKKERIYKKIFVNKNLSSKYNAIKKNAAIKQKDDPLYKHSISIEEKNELDIPDKSDNLLPKITRKYDSIPPARRSLKEIKIDKLEFDLPKMSLSTPNSPDDESKISLNDRALKLKIAKEEFLNKSDSTGTVKQENNNWNNRHSRMSAGSESSTEDGTLLTKSSSVGMIEASPNDNQHVGGYVSLPRNIRPTVKSSRFGLSNIAQKLRKVKLRKSNKETNKMNTISTLCRQSLMVDITGETKAINPVIMECSSSCSNDKEQQCTIIEEKKLQTTSSGTTFNFNIRFRRNEQREKLKKSKSVGTIEEQRKYEDQSKN